MIPLVATVSHTGMLCVNYVTSMFGISPVPDVIFPCSSSITTSRNEAVRKFRSGDWTDLFFIDSDVGFSPRSFRRALCCYDVTAGAYPFRSDDIAAQGGFVVDRDEVGPVQPDGFAPVQHAPCGFMRISRRALEMLPDAPFDNLVDDEGSWNEDHAFCRRWRSVGGTIFLDTEAELTHQGTKIWKRDFRAYLEKPHGDH